MRVRSEGAGEGVCEGAAMSGAATGDAVRSGGVTSSDAAGGGTGKSGAATGGRVMGGDAAGGGVMKSGADVREGTRAAREAARRATWRRGDEAMRW